jgi:hypothetical protein
LFSYHVGKQLGIDVADTRLAKSGDVLGIASYDIGTHEEPSDDDSYSVKDFAALDGFVDMCLFDYLVMNEDRHARNWGIAAGKVARLFDHNICFGGDIVATDFEPFMVSLTSSFYVEEDRHRHDAILEYLVKHHAGEVASFMRRLDDLSAVSNTLWEKHFADDCQRLNKLLAARVLYMKRKVGEYIAE